MLYIHDVLQNNSESFTSVVSNQGLRDVVQRVQEVSLLMTKNGSIYYFTAACLFTFAVVYRRKREVRSNLCFMIQYSRKYHLQSSFRDIKRC